MRHINGFLRSEAATLVLLALALIAQAPHAATVFHRLAPPAVGFGAVLSWIHASSYAIALELATLVFVVRGQKRLSWLFAGVSVMVNVAYYWRPDIPPVDLARAMLIAIALPAAIATYSHDVARHSARDHVSDAPEAPRTPVPAQTTYDTEERQNARSGLSERATGASEAPSVSTAERRALIAGLLERVGEDGIDRAELAEQFGVHPSTIGRDLRVLNGLARGRK
ncbi:MAG: hypothetical protein KatS3mg051_2037 [Anaerolineae bacterium]|nr:MAG: hypothetical protein KatS3mg051_2037 [Anaerolineae bacterium]